MTCWIVCQCQEKPTDESPSPVLAHAAMVVQVLLQVGENALNLVVRVGHPLAASLLVGEQVRQVVHDAVHRRPQALVGVVRLARTLACRQAVERMFPPSLHWPNLFSNSSLVSTVSLPMSSFRATAALSLGLLVR